MDRRRASLVLLLLFAVCTGVAIVVSGSRPGLQQGIAPTVVQFVGYLFALVAAVLLLASPGGGPGETRKVGAAVLGALLVLVLLDLFVLGDTGGANIGGGLVRVVGLVVMTVATLRLARGLAPAGRTR
jgi:peptidoglycan/LPS O-acetylase OafA/YrhL